MRCRTISSFHERRVPRIMRLRLNCMAMATLFLAVCGFRANAELFDPLFRVSAVSGDVTIVKPGSTVSEKVLEAHAYPYGSRLIVPKVSARGSITPEVVFSLSQDNRFRLSAGSDLTVSHGEGGDVQKKVLTLASGRLRVTISPISILESGVSDAEAAEAKINAISVVTPLATCFRMKTDRNDGIGIRVDSDGKHTTVRAAVENGSMEISGDQFTIEATRRGAAIELFGNVDYTRITCHAGEFIGRIEKGVEETEQVLFRTQSTVKIWRKYADIGGRMAVSVMSVRPDRSFGSYSYLEGEQAVSDTPSVAFATDSQVGSSATSEVSEGAFSTIESDPFTSFSDDGGSFDASSPGLGSMDFGGSDDSVFSFDGWGD